MAAEYPMVSVSGSNPIPAFFEMQQEEFSVGRTIYDDLGADFKLQHGGSGVKRWIIRYDGLLAADAALLDAHLASTFYSPDEGSAIGFNFRTHIAGEAWSSTNGTLYGSVHYAPGGYKTGHGKTWTQSREVILEKRG